MKRRCLIAIPTLDGRITASLAWFLCNAERRSLDAGYPWEFAKGIFQGYRPVPYMRNVICGEFLRSDCDKLWFLDADILPPPSAFDMLEIEADMVAGAVTGMREAAGGNGIVLRIMAFKRNGDGLESIEPEGFKPIDIDGAGTGCLIIDRKIIDDPQMRLRTGYWLDAAVPPIFRLPLKENGEIQTTADLDFCARARKLGYSIKLWPNELFGQTETLDLRDVAAYGIECAKGANRLNK